MTKVYWNIFVRELQSILRDRGLDLGDLTTRAGIHAKKVQRLLQSLHSLEKGLPILDAEEIQQVNTVLLLNEQERIRLRAALLTSATQRTLSQYIEHNDIQLIAEQIFPTILRSLVSQAEKENADDTRGGDFAGSEDTELDSALATALEAIDGGIEELLLSANINSHTKKVKNALHARASFTTAIDDLRHLSLNIQWQPGWQYWYSKAQKGLAQANRLLEEFNEA